MVVKKRHNQQRGWLFLASFLLIVVIRTFGSMMWSLFLPP